MLLRAPSILITDDDVDFRETLRFVFEPQGFRTLLAGNGEEALEIVDHEEVDLLLLDMHMPRLTGLETIRRVKQSHSRLPCILLSAGLDEGLIRQAQQAQAFSVLSKPVSRFQLTSTVQAAFERTYDVRTNPAQPGATDTGGDPSASTIKPTFQWQLRINIRSQKKQD